MPKMNRLVSGLLRDNRETLKCLKLRESRKAYKNLLGLCISFLLCFGSYAGILNQQTSLNSRGGLGLWTVGTLYTLFVVAGVLGPALVRLIGSKYALMVAACLFMVYAILNYYPAWGTLMVGSILIGLLGYSTIWTAIFTHATVTAIKYAPALGEEPQHTVSLFAGAVGLSLKLSRVFGNGISTIILWNLPSNDTTGVTNDTIGISNNTSDGAVCDNVSAAEVENSYIYYVMITVYVTCIITALSIMLTTVDHFAVDTKIVSCRQALKQYLLQPVVDALRLSVNWKCVLLTPLSFTNGFIIGISASIYPKLYVADCYGVQWVGVGQVVYGVVGGVSAMLAGRLVKYLPHWIMLYVALGVFTGLSVFLVIWDNNIPSYYVMFGMAVAFSLAEGIINGLVPGIYGYIFQEQKEVALGLFQQWLGAGIAVCFFIFEALRRGVEAAYVHTYMWSIAIAVATVTAISYTVLVLLTWSKKELLIASCCRQVTNSTREVDQECEEDKMIMLSAVDDNIDIDETSNQQI